MTTTWILVANASKARIYSANKVHLLSGDTELDCIGEYNHPNSRKKKSELISDRFGNHKGMKLGTGTFVEAADPKRIEAESFARKLSELLEQGRVANVYQELILVAPPQFHGYLNKENNGHISTLVRVNIDKDYTHDTEKQLRGHLEEYL